MDEQAFLEFLDKKKIYFQVVEQSSPITSYKIPAELKEASCQLLQALSWNDGSQHFLFVFPFSHLLSISKTLSFLTTPEKDKLIQNQLLKKKYLNLTSISSWPEGDFLVIADGQTCSKEYVAFILENPKKAVLISTKDFQEHFMKNQRRENFALSVMGDSGINMQEFDRGSLSFYDQTQIKTYFTDDIEFPVMSQTARELLRLRSDPDADSIQLSNIVRQSPTLAAQVVRWANSPYYGFPGSINTIEDAIVRVLGFDLVIHLAIGLAVSQSFRTPDVGPLALTRYWQHSLYTTAMTDRLLRDIPVARRPSLGICQLSALLHNFGYMVLGEFFPDHFNLINQSVMINPHLSNELIERYILGVSHSYLGFLLMQHWNMPEELIDANLYHHSSLEYSHPNSIMVYTIQVAIDSLRSEGIGDGSLIQPDPSILEFLRISEDQRQQALFAVRANIALDEMAREIANA